MPVPLTLEQLLALIRKSDLIGPERLDAVLDIIEAAAGALPEPPELIRLLVERGLLTNFQAEQLLLGKWRGFTIGKYKVLERLGAGGMGSVYLCEHMQMGRKVAVKVLPVARNNDEAALGRFRREARAAGSLDHPNLVRAHDIDQDGEMHYLVMDYVDGVNLQRLVAKITGPLPVARACDYIRQAALGLDYAFRAGLVHRDVKPANILVDRQGAIRILDLGLARFYEDNNDLLTRMFDDNNVLGTADYVSPEQAEDSHEVDVRTDIYSLGATFYFCLTGQPLFPEGKVAQKLIWHQTREPTPIVQLRPDLPAGLAAVIEKMLAKKREDRYATPAEVVAALAPWTGQPVPLPTAEEIPPLSPAARLGTTGDSSMRTSARTPSPDSRAPATRHQSRPAAVLPRDRPTRALTASSQSTDHATPCALASETATACEQPAAQPAPVAALAATVRPAAPRHSWKLAVLLVTIVGSAAAGVALRLKLKGEPAGGGPAERAAVLVVSRAGTPDSFPTIRAALDAAQSGDRIQVRETEWEEALRLDRGGALGKGVIVEGGAGGVVWRVPPGHNEGLSLLHLSSVAGLTLRNFTLDGRDQVQHLVTLSGPCPGLTLEDVHLRGFRTSAVHLTGCTGEACNPVHLRRLHVAPGREAETGLLLESYPDQACRHVRVRDCQFEGPCQAGVIVVGPLAEVELSGNRFAQLGDGVLCRRAVSPFPIHLTLTGNVFRDLRRAALHFETAPAVEGSQIAATKNRFVRTPTLGLTDGFRPEPLRTAARWIWGAEAGAQRYSFRKAFSLESAPTRAVLSITCADRFTVWLNGQRVGEGNFATAPRVLALDVARYLSQGDNVLAVEGSGRPGAAGLLAELDDNGSGVFTRTLSSDATWKAVTQPVPGWQGRASNDKAWPAVKVLAAYGGGAPAWRNLTWDAVVQEHFKYQAARVFPAPSGNERDAASREGFPSFDATVVPAEKLEAGAR